jgi:hypothetical protein
MVVPIWPYIDQDGNWAAIIKQRKMHFSWGKTMVFGIGTYLGDVISRNPKCRSKRLDFFTASLKLTQEGSNIG